MTNETLERFMKHLEEGHDAEIRYKDIEYSIADCGEIIYVDGKAYNFSGKTHEEIVAKFVKTAIFPDGKSIEEADPEITFTFSSNDID